VAESWGYLVRIGVQIDGPGLSSRKACQVFHKVLPWSTSRLILNIFDSLEVLYDPAPEKET
jgi:hypothetical protein